MISIGPYQLRNPVVLAPMAGVTDLAFRSLAWRLGAGLVVAEMVSARPDLVHTELSRRRRAHAGESGPRSVQIVGADPAQLADAARANVDEGAEIIDINMGCPAKQVCKQAAGSALMADPAQVERILRAVVGAVNVPVTLKTRTGPHPGQRNGVAIARLAEDCGVQSLAVHGRTRACRFVGRVEYDTIAAIKAAVRIPVFANGDIDSPEAALRVLAYTLPGQIAAAMAGDPVPAAPTPTALAGILREHVQHLHSLYGEERGLRIARKHVGWYFDAAAVGAVWRQRFNALEDAPAQLALLEQLFDELENGRLAA
jgi:tRNA-dihydrouridine synthase B